MEISELDSSIQKYNEGIETLKNICNEILEKSVEQITIEDIKEYELHKSKIHFGCIAHISKIKEKLVKRQHKIAENLEKGDSVTPEEEKQITEDITRIEAIETEYNEVIKEAEEKITQAHNIIVQKELEQVEPKMQQLKAEIESYIKEPSNPKGAIMHIIDEINPYYKETQISEKVVSEKIQVLVEKYKAFDKKIIKKYTENHSMNDREVSFRQYEECSLEDKQKIEEYEQKVSSILTSEDKEFDKPGRISIPVYLKDYLYDNDEQFRNLYSKSFKFRSEVTEMFNLDIDITPRELAKSGIDYEDFNWKSLEQIKEEEKAKVTSKIISMATTSLPMRAINRVKEIFSREKSHENIEKGE